MRQPNVLIVDTKYRPGWPTDAPLTGQQTLPVDVALTREWPTDAAFAPYISTLNRRLKHEAAPLGTAWAMTCFVVDVDAAAGHRRTPEWDAAFRARVARLPGCPYSYFTRGGARAVWALASPYPIESADDVVRWELRYLRRLASVYAMAAIIADPTCRDPSRLFRLPLVVREGHAERHGLASDASASEFGAWDDEWLLGPDDQLLAIDETVSSLQTADPDAAKAWCAAKKLLYPPRPSPVVIRRPLSSDGARAEKYLEKVEAAVQGANGSAALMRTARLLHSRFDLCPHNAISLLMRSYNNRCHPPWPAADIERAVKNVWGAR